MPRALVAMSGGVDSSVAAALLVEAGWEVVGVHFKQVEEGTHPASCCSLEAAELAGEVAARLSIPFYVWDLKESFARQVIASTISGYLQGLTPNPCLLCNRSVRFGLALERAKALGFDALATGHYARVVRTERGPRLARGADRRHDQSYMLAALAPRVLEDLVFPLGGMAKEEVRGEARRRGLPNWGRRDSQDLCFLPLLRRALERMPPRALREEGGRVLGSLGVPVTVGQRRGLGLPEGHYVLEVRAGEVVVGREEGLFRKELLLDEVFLWEPLERLEGSRACTRYRSQEVPVSWVGWEGPFLDVVLGEPARAAAPGQYLVFYMGELVAGGGRIVLAR